MTSNTTKKFAKTCLKLVALFAIVALLCVMLTGCATPQVEPEKVEYTTEEIVYATELYLIDGIMKSCDEYGAFYIGDALYACVEVDELTKRQYPAL
jgi:hypothetical protein